VHLVVDANALLADISVLGRVVAPRAITAADLTLESAPSYAYPGCTLLLRFVVQQGAKLAARSAEEKEVSLGAAAAATHFNATLEAEGAARQSLKAHFSADAPGRCVTISIDVPQDAPVGSSVCFSPLTVFGQPMAKLLGPLVVKVGGADLIHHSFVRSH
jgi:hypothetical protein